MPSDPVTTTATDIALAAAQLHPLCEGLTSIAQRASQRPQDEAAQARLASEAGRVIALAGRILEGARAIAGR